MISQVAAAYALAELLGHTANGRHLPEGQWIVYRMIGLECALFCQDQENPRDKIVPWAVFLEASIQSDGKFMHVQGRYRGVNVLVAVKIPKGARV